MFTRYLIAVAATLLLASPALAADRPPNIIYILADDLGYGELGSYGQTKIRTPHLDRLAAKGMRFTNHYSGAPVCAPSRCVLMTGLHGGHAYARSNWENNPSVFGDSFGGQLPLPDETITVAEVLKQKGYATGAFGKWGLGGVGTPGDPLKQGFDRFFGYNCQRHAHNFYPRYLVDDDKQRPLPGNDRGLTGKHYASQLIADEMLKFIRDHKDEPFFVYYPTLIPHLALQVPDEELEPYRKLGWKETPYKGRSYLPHDEPRAAYAAMISFMDKQVGRIVAQLEELGLTDNTIIVFSSDNGPTHLNPQVDVKFFDSAGGLRGLKGSLYEGGIRVPMIAYWPGKVRPGTTSDHTSAFQDVMPTLADLAGAKAPQNIDGISFAPTLLGKGRQKPHRYLVWEFHGYGGQQAVRMGTWKALRRNCYRNPDGPIELYNLATDPAERTNIADQHPELVQRIADILKAEHTATAVDWDFAKGHPKTRKK